MTPSTLPEPMLAFVLRKLEESKGKWTEISEKSGVPYHTLTKIALCTVPDPRISTIQKLANHFGYQGLPAPAEALKGAMPAALAS